jgi:hypothetical protein
MIERLSAALANRYRIERQLGAGGMATVYLRYFGAPVELPPDHIARKSMNTTLMVLLTLPLLAATASAQGRGGSDSAQAARQEAAN